MNGRTLAILLVVTAAAAACRQPAADTQADVAAIQAAIQEAAAAHGAGDAARWAGGFTGDGVLLPEGAPTVTGRDSLAAWIGALYNANQVTMTIEPLEIEVAGDWAFSRDRFSGTLTPKAGGAAVPMVGKEIVIWRRQADASWKAARVIFNSNQSPAPQP